MLSRAASIGAAPGKDYLRTVQDLRTLKGVFLQLEAAIAAVPCGSGGVTRPGAFLFELLERVHLNSGSIFPMLALLEEACDLLSDNAVDHGRT